MTLMVLAVRAIVSRSGKDSAVIRRDGGRKRGRRETSFANLWGKCRFQVASRAQLPGTGWARAGMKFRLVQQEQAKCAHPLCSARPGELSFAMRERERPRRERRLGEMLEKATETERQRASERVRGGQREGKEISAGCMGWCNTVIANNGTTMRVHVSRADQEIDLRKETPVIGHRLPSSIVN